MIIDAHVHIFPPEIRKHREHFCKVDRNFSAIYQNPRSSMATAEELLQVMEDCGVEMAVVLGFPWKDVRLCQQHNDYIAEVTARWPKRFIGLGCVSPTGGSRSLDEAHRCIQMGLRGIGELAIYDSGGVQLEGAFFNGLAELLSEAALPLLLHTSESVGHHYPGKDYTDLRSVYEWIKGHPDLDIILAHWGGGLIFYELMPEVQEACRRVHYDTAASPFLYDPKIYSLAASIAGPHRILFGSDYPLLSPERYLREIDSQRLDGTIRRAILGENASRLWGLT
jgi:hypothetical protein